MTLHRDGRSMAIDYYDDTKFDLSKTKMDLSKLTGYISKRMGRRITLANIANAISTLVDGSNYNRSRLERFSLPRVFALGGAGCLSALSQVGALRLHRYIR